MNLAIKSPDRWALGAALVVFAGVLGWTLWGEKAVGKVSAAVDTTLAGALSDQHRVTLPEAVVERTWTSAAASDDPEVWGFDVFTPPVIYYDPETGRFSVAAPAVIEVNDENMAQPFGLQLLSVERQGYELQLVGYAGTEADPIGIFANEVSGEGIVARVGYRFVDLDLELRKLAIRREEMLVPDSMPLREIVAEAEIWDARTRRTLHLSSARPAWNDQPLAEMLIPATGERRLVTAGNRIELADGVIEITGVFARPDSVTAVKRLTDGSRESLRLTPEPAIDSQFDGDTLFESP